MRFQSDLAVLAPTEYNPVAIALSCPTVKIGETTYSTIPTREKIDLAVLNWGTDYFASLDEETKQAAYAQVACMGGIGRAACYVYEEWRSDIDRLSGPPQEIVVELNRHDLTIMLEGLMGVMDPDAVQDYLRKDPAEIDAFERLVMKDSIAQFLVGRDLLAELHKRLGN